MSNLLPESTMSKDHRIHEKDLILPALMVLAQAEKVGHGAVSSFQLYAALRQALVLSDDDHEATPGARGVSRFRRTVYNMVSHNTLIENRLATYSPKGFKITKRGKAMLLDIMLGPTREIDHSEPPVATENAARVFEDSVAFRMLIRLAELQKGPGVSKPISMTKLRREVKASLPMSEEDLGALKNRTDTRIDQIIRNVVSHDTLTRPGYARYDQVKGGLSITATGKSFVLDQIIDVVPAPNFAAIALAERAHRSRSPETRANSPKVF
jgi:hypothetical protein